MSHSERTEEAYAYFIGEYTKDVTRSIVRFILIPPKGMKVATVGDKLLGEVPIRSAPHSEPTEAHKNSTVGDSGHSRVNGAELTQIKWRLYVDGSRKDCSYSPSCLLSMTK